MTAVADRGGRSRTAERPPLFTVALVPPPIMISVPPLEIIVLIVVPPDRTFATPPLRRSRPALVWPEETMIVWPPLTTVRGRTLKLSSANQPLESVAVIVTANGLAPKGTVPENASVLLSKDSQFGKAAPFKPLAVYVRSCPPGSANVSAGIVKDTVCPANQVWSGIGSVTTGGGVKGTSVPSLSMRVGVPSIVATAIIAGLVTAYARLKCPLRR